MNNCENTWLNTANAHVKKNNYFAVLDKQEFRIAIFKVREAKYPEKLHIAHIQTITMLF